jgi:hypothetical protein
VAGVPGQGDEEPVPAGQVGQLLGALQRELPVGADLRHPSAVVAVLGAQQRGADRAEEVMPGRRPDLAARPEPAQHPEAHQHAEPVPGSDDAVKPESAQLVGGQHPVLAGEPDQVAVPFSQVTSSSKHRLILLYVPPARRPPVNGRFR